MNYLLFADTLRSPDMRHAVPILTGDPFPYLETAGKRYVFVVDLEIERYQALGGLEVIGYSELGDLDPELNFETAATERLTRACRYLDVTDAIVPDSFPLGFATRLSQQGITVTPDGPGFAARRRQKLPKELAGIRNAQAAIDHALAEVREVVHGAEQISSESLKELIAHAVAGHEVLLDFAIVSHGPQTAYCDELGHGAISNGEPIIVDLAIRDVASGCYADTTRTFCRGPIPEELTAYHSACYDALSAVLPRVRPGVSGDELHKAADDSIAARGYSTPLTAGPEGGAGFIHFLGHGVGLEIHEAPAIGPNGPELVAGDVITIEPGVYRQGFGGCRIEDLLVVTETGFEMLTNFPYEL